MKMLTSYAVVVSIKEMDIPSAQGATVFKALLSFSLGAKVIAVVNISRAVTYSFFRCNRASYKDNRPGKVAKDAEKD